MSAAFRAIAQTYALVKWGRTRGSGALLSASLLGIAIALGSAAPATAMTGLKMYQGSLSLHFFGNDTTNLPTPPFSAYVFVALPLGAHCNPYLACTTATLQKGASLTGINVEN